MLRVTHRLIFCFIICLPLWLSMGEAQAYQLTSNAVLHGKKAMNHAAGQQWSKAQAAAARAGDKNIQTLIWWMKLRSDGASSEIDEYQKFLQQHPDWPDKERLLKQAERALRDEENNIKVVRWFASREPLTATGKIRLAEALLAQKDGAAGQAKGEELLRTAWRDGGLSRNHVRYLIDQYKQLLRAEDHKARADALIWNDELVEAQALIPYLPDAEQRLLKARIALKTDQGNVSKIVEQVPPRLRLDAGLIYDRMVWRNKRKLHDGVRELLYAAPNEVPHPEKWWSIRKKYVVRELDDKDYKGAYKLLKNHGQTEPGATLADAEWLAGWMAFKHLKDYNTAYTHFYKLYHGVSYPISKSRGAFWAALAADKHGKKAIARRWYEIAATHGHTYYGQLAQHQLKSRRLFALAAPIQVSRTQLRQYLSQEIPAATAVLTQLDQKRFAKKFVLHMVETARSDMERTLATMLGEAAAGRKDYGVQASKRALRYGTFIPEVGYPVLKMPRVDKLEPALMMAIARQESEFRVQASSSAGAKGLMQVLPSTARMVARKHGLSYSSSKLLRDPYYNMQIGGRYLASLLEDYNGHYIMAIAAYNAGPGRVRDWVERFGDPRNPRVDPILWVESIPFYETRNYVQRVMENLQIYRYIMNGYVPTPHRLPYDLRLVL